MRNVDLGIGWSAQLIRLSIFPQEAGALENLDLSMLAGVQAEQEEKRPRERFKRQAVAFHDGNLELQVSPLRADLLYLPRVQLAGPIPDFAALLLPEPFSDRLHEFMSSCRQCNRSLGSIDHSPSVGGNACGSVQ